MIEMIFATFVGGSTICYTFYLLSMLGRNFDVISDNIVLLYLEGSDPGFLSILGLQFVEKLGRMITQFTYFVQFRRESIQEDIKKWIRYQ